MNRLSSRLRLTEGQLYSSAIVLVLALLLLSGLGHVHAVVSSALAEGPVVGGPAAQVPVAGVPTPTAQPVALPPLDLPSTGFPRGPQPVPAPVPTQVVEQPLGPTTVPVRSAPTPSKSPCALQGEYDTAIQTLRTVNDAAGGRLPANDVIGALGLVTGCDPADPAVIAVGLLIGIGHALPDPGLPAPPPLPFVQIPASVVSALQPARAVIDQACGLVGTGQAVASLFITAYPQPVPQLTTQVLFTALGACGQVRQP
jgi:hypothetical protein